MQQAKGYLFLQKWTIILNYSYTLNQEKQSVYTSINRKEYNSAGCELPAPIILWNTNT